MVGKIMGEIYYILSWKDENLSNNHVLYHLA